MTRTSMKGIKGRSGVGGFVRTNTKQSIIWSTDRVMRGSGRRNERQGCNETGRDRLVGVLRTSIVVQKSFPLSSELLKGTRD